MTRSPRLSLPILTMLATHAAASNALAADVERGRQLVQTHCNTCHSAPSTPRNEVADAPPFTAIARKYGYDASALAFAILAPHPKMNFMPERADAGDIAAFLATLPR